MAKLGKQAAYLSKIHSRFTWVLSLTVINITKHGSEIIQIVLENNEATSVSAAL
jgi:hypothetical protein